MKTNWLNYFLYFNIGAGSAFIASDVFTTEARAIMGVWVGGLLAIKALGSNPNKESK